MTRKSKVENLCEDALKKIDDAIDKHLKGEPSDLSISMLNKVRYEVERMKDVLKPSIFKPTFQRFVMDWPDEHGLIGFLIELAYQYEKIKD